MMNKSTLPTIRLLPSILTIQPTFLKTFYLFFIFYSTPKFLPQKLAHDSKKGPSAENDRRPERGPEALDDPEAARVGEHLQLLPPFLGSPGG